MLRSTLLYLSNQPRVFRFVRNNKLAKKFASRFVAGETLPEALEAVKALNAKGITASLDLLGESVNNEKEARSAANDYLGILDSIRQQNLNAKGFASRATFEVSEASRDQGMAAVNSARAAYDAARDNVEVTKAQQAEARAQLSELQTSLALSLIHI